MRIAIDFTAFIPQMTGVDTYLKQLVLHLAKVDQHNQYMIYHNREDRRFFADNLPANFSHTSLSVRPRLIRLISQQLLLPVAPQLGRRTLCILHRSSCPIYEGRRDIC